jgi:hypothetical protein
VMTADEANGSVLFTFFDEEELLSKAKIEI